MAKNGDKIYFGKLVNSEADLVQVIGVVSYSKYKARRYINTIVELMEVELVQSSVSDTYTLFEDLGPIEKELFRNVDFYLYEPESLR